MIGNRGKKCGREILVETAEVVMPGKRQKGWAALSYHGLRHLHVDLIRRMFRRIKRQR